MDTKELFKPDRNQALAVVAMLVAVFTFATGEIVIGFICFGAAAVLSLGGLFWSAHRADKAALVAAARIQPGDAETPQGAALQPQAQSPTSPTARDAAPSSIKEPR